MEIVDPRSQNIMRLEQARLDVDSFFEKSNRKLVEFEYLIQKNKLELEQGADFHSMRDSIQRSALILEERIQEIKFEHQIIVERFEIMNSMLQEVADQVDFNPEIDDKYYRAEDVRNSVVLRDSFYSIPTVSTM